MGTKKPRYNTPKKPNKQFLNKASHQFKASLGSVYSVDDDQWKQEYIKRTVSYVSEVIDDWLLRGAFTDDHGNWDNDVRVISALRTAIAEGDLVFESENDIWVFCRIIEMEFVLYPEVIEHYVHTGELAEITRVLDETRGSTHEKEKELRVRMFRIYDYDMSTSQEHKDLPLEIRLSFCGYADEITQGEWKWFSLLRYDMPSGTDVLSLFREAKRGEEQ